AVTALAVTLGCGRPETRTAAFKNAVVSSERTSTGITTRVLSLDEKTVFATVTWVEATGALDYVSNDFTAQQTLPELTLERAVRDAYGNFLVNQTHLVEGGCGDKGEPYQDSNCSQPRDCMCERACFCDLINMVCIRPLGGGGGGGGWDPWDPWDPWGWF
ncbi:MAG: hypothetical protein JNK82_38515, partial [Myxococcaceae bacterium]|nr:hypothetical protein [Myxococcaceae bacterium]